MTTDSTRQEHYNAKAQETPKAQDSQLQLKIGKVRHGQGRLNRDCPRG